KTGTYWIGDLREYDGDIAGCLLQRDQRYRRTGKEHVRLESNQLGGLSPHALEVCTAPTSLDSKVFARHPAKLLEPLPECIEAIASLRLLCSVAECPAHTRHPAALGAARERPGNRRAAEKRDEVAPPHVEHTASLPAIRGHHQQMKAGAASLPSAQPTTRHWQVLGWC